MKIASENKRQLLFYTLQELNETVQKTKILTPQCLVITMALLILVFFPEEATVQDNDVNVPHCVV